MSNDAKAKQLTAGAINLIRYYQEAVLSPAPGDAVIDHMLDRLADFAGRHSDGAADGAAFRVAINRLVTQCRMTLAVGLEYQRRARMNALEEAKRALCEWCAAGRPVEWHAEMEIYHHPSTAQMGGCGCDANEICALIAREETTHE